MVRKAEITEDESLLLTRRISIFNISYIRELFPEKYFNQKNVPALEMKIKKLMPVDAESWRLIDWMEKGKHVIHSVAAEKLHEVRQALDFEAMDVDVNALQNKLNHAVADKIGNKKADGSTCGVLHSIGYDIACMQARSEFDTHQKGSLRSDQYISKTREIPYNPTSKTVPADSRESTIPGSGKTVLNGQTKKFKAGDIMCSRPSQDKRSRKASMGAMKMALLLLGWSLCLLLSISVPSEATTDPNDGSLIIPQHFQTIPNLRIGGNDFIRFPRKLLNMQKKRGKALETKVIIIMAFTLALVLVGKYQFGLRLSRQVLFKWLRLRIHRQAKPQAAEPPAELQVAEPPVELVRVPAAEHPRDPANCVLLLITIAKGFMLCNEKDIALGYFRESGVDVNAASIHGMRPFIEQKGVRRCKSHRAVSSKLKDEIHDMWYSINDDGFDRFKSFQLAREQYIKHGWKIRQFPTMFAYMRFTLQSFRKLNLNFHSAQIRQGIDQTNQFVDKFGQTWYCILGENLLMKLEQLYTFAPILDVFRKKRMKRWFVKEILFGYDVTDGVLADTSSWNSSKIIIGRNDKKEFLPSTTYVCI